MQMNNLNLGTCPITDTIKRRLDQHEFQILTVFEVLFKKKYFIILSVGTYNKQIQTKDTETGLSHQSLRGSVFESRFCHNVWCSQADMGLSPKSLETCEDIDFYFSTDHDRYKYTFMMDYQVYLPRSLLHTLLPIVGRGNDLTNGKQSPLLNSTI